MRKRGHPEHTEQSRLVYQLQHMLRPGLVQMAVPNGGLRHPRVALQLKAEGLVPGSPDLVFALEEAKVFWLEMKSSDGTLSVAQQGMHAKLRRLGHTVETAWSCEQALDILQAHGLLR